MVRLAHAAIAVLMMGSLAFAQETPKVQVFGGFSLFHADHAGLTGTSFSLSVMQPPDTFGLRNYFLGWNAEGQYNFDRWFGIAADFGARSGSPITAVHGVTGLPNSSSYSFLGGPVISYRTKSIFTPYIHLLFGWERTTLDASVINAPFSQVTTRQTTATDVVMSLGGGLDCKVNHHISLRLAQIDWYHTSLNLDQFYESAYPGDLFNTLGNHEDNVRISTGLVVKF